MARQRALPKRLALTPARGVTLTCWTSSNSSSCPSSPRGGAGASPGGGPGAAPEPVRGLDEAVRRSEEIFRILTIRPNYTLDRPVNRALIASRFPSHLDDHQQVAVARGIESIVRKTSRAFSDDEVSGRRVSVAS